MGQDEINGINVRLLGIEQNLDKLTIAIQGDKSLAIDGVVQHMSRINMELLELKSDVKSLKDDRKTIKGWIAGLAAAGGFGGAIGHWFSK